MARMSIDDKVCRDPRITVLAEILGWSRRETVGCLVLDVWPICYDQECHLLSERSIDAAARHPGFAKAMIESELATLDRSGKVRVNGAKERIEYLNHKKRAGREGGIKSAYSRANHIKQTSSTRGSTPQAAGNPSVPDPVSASASASASASVPVPASVHTESGSPDGLADLFSKVDAAAGDVGKARNTKAAKQKAATNPEHQAAIDGFHVRYKAKYGTKPTWDGKSIGMLSSLLRKHPLAVLLSRMDFMFAGIAKWPPGPYSMDVFVNHIDRWVEDKPSYQPPTRRIEEL
jgi:hypothetical protein